MTNAIKFFIAILGVVFALSVNAQDYKHPYGLIDKDGKITDSTGKYLGSITIDGMIKDASGAKIAHVDGKGNLVDAKSGKILGKFSKNGTFVYHFDEKAKDTLTIGGPMNGTCEVKNSNGKVILLVHENYKQYGACAFHCQAIHNKKGYMKMK